MSKPLPEQSDTLTGERLIEAFRRSVKELRDAEDNLIAGGGAGAAGRLLLAIDRYFVLRQAVIDISKLDDAVRAMTAPERRS